MAVQVQHCAIAFPIEMRPRIGFAPRSDVAMTDYVFDRIMRPQRARQHGEDFILSIREWRVIRAFHLDPDRVVVAAEPAFPAGYAGVPRALGARHELYGLAITPDQKVRGNPDLTEGGVIGMGARIEPVGEKRFDPRTPEFPGRQADRVDHDQLDGAARRPLVAIGRSHVTHALGESIISDTQLQAGEQ